MIYLIGGPPRSGKSTLAHKLARRLRCPEISIDWLRSVVLPYLNDDDKRILIKILHQDNQAEEQVKTDEAEVLWPAVKSFIEDKARWQHDFVLDGIHLLPKYLQEIDDTVKPNTTAIFLVKTDEQKILEGFDKVRFRKNDWLLNRHGKDPGYLERAAKEIAERGQYFSKEAKKHGFTIINTEDDFEAKLHALTEELYLIRKNLRAKNRRASKTTNLAKTPLLTRGSSTRNDNDANDNDGNP